MDFVINLLSQQPLMTLFLTVALGYLLGEVNIKGFSLGAGAVLFVAITVCNAETATVGGGMSDDPNGVVHPENHIRQRER